MYAGHRDPELLALARMVEAANSVTPPIAKVAHILRFKKTTTQKLRRYVHYLAKERKAAERAVSEGITTTSGFSEEAAAAISAFINENPTIAFVDITTMFVPMPLVPPQRKTWGQRKGRASRSLLNPKRRLTKKPDQTKDPTKTLSA